MSSIVPNDPGSRVRGTELEVRWRSSRHARRLLTLGLFGVFAATLARRPEFAGVAAPALLLLAAGRVQRRPPRIAVRARPCSRRGFEGELMALDVTVDIPGDGDDSPVPENTVPENTVPENMVLGNAVQWTLHPGREIAPVGAPGSADGRCTGSSTRCWPAT